jgi:two-component system sensor histidine kinase CpxA
VSFRSAGELRIKDADPQALRIACENVIRNAVWVTRPGTNVEVVFEIDRSTPKSLAVLSVRDHGPGVPEESLDAIFQPFIELAATRKNWTVTVSVSRLRQRRFAYITA